MVNIDSAEDVLARACKHVGIAYSEPTLLRAGENTLFQLHQSVVARVTREGQAAVAAKEVKVSRWLHSINFPVVEAIDFAQPVVVGNRAVTFWKLLPPHVPGSPAELADLLVRLHALEPPAGLGLPRLDPLTRLQSRIDQSNVLEPHERAWLTEHLHGLAAQWEQLPSGRQWCAVHGDAWSGNVASTDKGPIFLDLERFAYGPPEWDLAAMAVDFETFSSMPLDEWNAVCDRYGYDVRGWAGYPTLRDIRELRKVTFAFQTAENLPAALDQARYRLACIKGEAGPRPWGWVGVV